MSEYLFCGLLGATMVALSVALTLLCDLFECLWHKHLTKQRKAKYKHLKRLQRKAKQVEQYAEFVAIAESVKK